MKRYLVFLLMFVPSLLGWLADLLLTAAPSAGQLILWGFTFFTLVVWYFAGAVFASEWKNPLLAIPAANGIGLLSLLLFLWQEYLTPEKNPAFQAVTQYFSGGITMLSLQLSSFFGKEVDGMLQVPMTAVQIVGFLLLAVIFSVGYLTARQKLLQSVATSKNG